MKLARRSLLAVLLVAAGALSQAHAQQYPNQPIRIIVPFAPGGGTDVAVRIIAVPLGTELGQPVVVENVGGAGGTIGAARGAQAAPDGYTLFAGTPSTHGTNLAVYPKLSYHPVRDFTPIALIGTSPFLLLAHPSVPARSAKELIELAKGKPGELNYASYGNGSINHLGLELFSSMAGIDVRHVPYKGSAPALQDLIAGRVQYTFDGPASVPAVKAGQVRLLAVGAAKRWAQFPDVPTVSESALPGFDLSTWYGLFAPARTPAPIVARVNAGMNKVLALPQVKESFAKLNLDPAGGTPEVLAKQVLTETSRWVEIANKKNIRIGQ